MPSTDQNPERVAVILRNLVDEMRKASMPYITPDDLEKALNNLKVR